MNEYLKLYEERRKKNIKEIELVKQKFESLSLLERNSYEQIIKRERERHRELFFPIPFKALFYIGLFLIVFSFMSGVPIEIFRPIFLVLVTPVFLATILLLIIDFLDMTFNSYNINKLKLKLLK